MQDGEYKIVYRNSFNGSIKKVSRFNYHYLDEENSAHRLRDSIVRAERKKVLSSERS